MRRLVYASLLLVWGSSPALASQETPPADEGSPLNVLLICVDDLRPDLGAYGVDHAHTPALDRFLASARAFRRHYVQVPTCGASRRALLTGLRPRQRVHVGNGACRYLPEETESVAHHFRREGYRTVVLGKVSHTPMGFLEDEEPESTWPRELPLSWETTLRPSWPWKGTGGGFFGYADGSSRERGQSPTTERGPAGARYPDAYLADLACRALEHHAAEMEAAPLPRPFFLALGFYKPHLPFTAPEEHWARFDAAPPPAASARGLPPGAPDIAAHSSGELLRNYGSHPGDETDTPLTEEYARRLRQGYAAAVSYMDEQLGRVLATLETTGLDQSTVVVLWSDHGWHLGDQGLWGKHSLFERALLAPLAIRTPRLTNPGVASWSVVESVDVYPTLVELCGLPAAPEDLSGESLVPILNDPSWDDPEAVAISFWSKGQSLGRSLRTKRYRYTRWTKNGSYQAEELYEYGKGIDEPRNVAEERPQLRGALLERLIQEAPARSFQR